MQISFAVTAKLISAFDFSIQILQSLYFFNQKFQASSHLLWLYSLVCLGPGRKPPRPVFSLRGSNTAVTEFYIITFKLLHEDSFCSCTCWFQSRLVRISQSFIFYYDLSRVVRTPAFCIWENKDADQLRGNREADQRLCFRYVDSTIPLVPKYEISSL